MIVQRSKLVQYAIAPDLYFARRVGEGSPLSRDAFFNANPDRLITATYCAIGNDTDGWELEMYNGVNWVVVTPDTSYSLIITNGGLAALTNIKKGGMSLYFTGIKIINNTVLNPPTPITTWTNTQFMQAGEVVFSCGTNGSVHQTDENGNSLLKQILRWRFNSSSGGLQYILTLPPEGLGAESDDGSSEWELGAIGLYIKDPTDNATDVLFAVASLPNIVHKYASTVERVGNSIKLYFNTVLTNLGVVSNLQIMTEGDVNLPEVANENLINYPTDSKKRPYNCYLVDNLYGTNMPAIGVQRKTSATVIDAQGIDADLDLDWAWFQPSDNFISLKPEAFDDSVNNYDFVYWDADTTNPKTGAKGIYKLAQGVKAGGENAKQPVGVRVGNSVVFSGTIINSATSYQYFLELASTGADYDTGDELLIPVGNDLIFKVEITGLNASGGISAFRVIGPTCGDIAITGTPIMPAIYDPRSQLPREGANARFKITATAMSNTQWNFPASYLNKPVYCDTSSNPGKVTNTQTDSMIGWCIASNGIQLGLDLRNEATEARYGTTRYATNTEVKQSVAQSSAATKTAVCPRYLKNNYFQITKSNTTPNANHPGDTQANPVIVDTFVKFNEIVLGKGTTTPYDNETANPYVKDSSISFYGLAYRAWYQDIAEFYEADKYYEPGTLITFGDGLKEITAATEEANGVISTKPGFQLGQRKSENWLPVALTGRVPVLFDNACMPSFGDKIYLSKVKKGCASTVENGKCLGKVIAKNFGSSRLIECVVRIDF